MIDHADIMRAEHLVELAGEASSKKEAAGYWRAKAVHYMVQASSLRADYHAR